MAQSRVDIRDSTVPAAKGPQVEGPQIEGPSAAVAVEASGIAEPATGGSATQLAARDVFEILCREHAAMLSLFLRATVHDAAEEDELFQRTMITAWQSLHRFDPSRPFGPWLRGIAAHHVMAWRRARRRAPSPLEQEFLDQLALSATRLEHRAGDTLDERLESLRECLGRLPNDARETLRLRYTEELDGAAMAARLSVTVEAIKKRVQRARTMLADCLARVLETPNAGNPRLVQAASEERT